MALLLTLGLQCVVLILALRAVMNGADDVPENEHSRIAAIVSLGVCVITAICYAAAHAITGQN